MRSLLFVTVTLLIIVNSEKVEILVGWLIGISLLSYVVKPFVIEEKP